MSLPTSPGSCLLAQLYHLCADPTMALSVLRAAALFGATAQALAYRGPRETLVASVPSDAQSPRPTLPPSLPELRRRASPGSGTSTFLVAPDNTCGYVSGLQGMLALGFRNRAAAPIASPCLTNPARRCLHLPGLHRPLCHAHVDRWHPRSTRLLQPERLRLPRDMSGSCPGLVVEPLRQRMSGGYFYGQMVRHGCLSHSNTRGAYFADRERTARNPRFSSATPSVSPAALSTTSAIR